jgi:hypothetical protein
VRQKNMVLPRSFGKQRFTGTAKTRACIQQKNAPGMADFDAGCIPAELRSLIVGDRYAAPRAPEADLYL